MTQLVITAKDQEEFIESLRVNDEQREQIASHPQGSEKWLESRTGRLTGSIIGSVVGHNFFTPHAKLLDELLWLTFNGNEATRYGSENEPKAAQIYTKYRTTQSPDFHVFFPGLFIHETMPWLGYSPDGLVWESQVPGLLEIKCPFKKKFYGRIQQFHYDQIQFGMFLTKRVYCDFVVHLPDQTSVERHVFNEPYVTEFLIPRANEFYFSKFLPLLLAKQKGWLPQGACTLPAKIQVEYFRPEIATAPSPPPPPIEAPLPPAGEETPRVGEVTTEEVETGKE